MLDTKKIYIDFKASGRVRSGKKISFQIDFEFSDSQPIEVGVIAPYSITPPVVSPYTPSPINLKQTKVGTLTFNFDVYSSKEQESEKDVSQDIDFFFSPVKESERLNIFTGGFDSLLIATPSIKTNTSFVNPISIKPTGIVNIPVIKNWNQNVSVQGISPPYLTPPLIYNLKQYLRVNNRKESTLYGYAYLQGGMRFVYAKGIVGRIGNVQVTNTTADQYINRAGIDDTGRMGDASVSPQTIGQAKTLAHSLYGTPTVERSPMPLGEVHTLHGKTTIWFHTRPVGAIGIDTLVMPAPFIYDPKQDVIVNSLLGVGIFGDTSIINKSKTINIEQGYFDSYISEYHVVENVNKQVSIEGITSPNITAHNIENKNTTLNPASINSIDIGALSITHAIQYVTPAGIRNKSLVSSKAQLTKTPELQPIGFIALNVGNAMIAPRVRQVKPIGEVISLFGNTKADLKTRYLKPDGYTTEDPKSYATVTYGNRVIQTLGFVSSRLSNKSWISHHTRTVKLLKGIGNQDNATAHRVSRNIVIHADGFVASLFGTRIIPESNGVYPEGIKGDYGTPTVDLYKRLLSPKGFESKKDEIDFGSRWGTVSFINMKQFIDVTIADDSNLIGGIFGEWTNVANRNKRISTFGNINSKLGNATFENKAEVIKPLSINSFSSGVNAVSHNIRQVMLSGIEPVYISSWHVIANNADVLSPMGFDAVQVSDKHYIATNRRQYKQIGMDSLVVATPMISHAIRRLEIERRYSISPPVICLPDIRLDTNYINTKKAWVGVVGNPTVVSHRNKVTTRGADSQSIGFPLVVNVTPELSAYGHNSELLGSPAVRNEYEHIRVMGDALSLFGKARIADTKQSIYLSGWHDEVLSDDAEVVKTSAPPYSEQRISLDGYYIPKNNEYIKGYGIGFGSPSSWSKLFGRPSLNQNIIYVDSSDSDMFLSGTPNLRTNVIEIASGIHDSHSVSNDAMVSLHIRRITQTRKDDVTEDEFSSVFGQPVMSPQTIWAVVEAPEQAKRIHPTKTDLHYVDGYAKKRPSSQIGVPKVTSKNISVFVRSIYPPGTRQTATMVSLSKRYIICKGISRPYFPSPSIPFTPQNIVVQQKSESSDFGLTSLTLFNLHRSVAPRGISNPQIDNKNRVALWVQSIKPDGLLSLSMGTKKTNDTPYTWQGLRVGPMVPIYQSGFLSEQFGDAFVSLKVREINPSGFYTFESRYTVESFDDRLSIVNALDSTQQKTLTIDVVGISANEGATFADVYNHTQHIRPDGNAEQYRKGAW